MKRLAVLLLAFSMVTYGQVKKVEKLADAADGKFYHATYSPDGKKVLLTSVNYKGLWVMDVQTKKVSKITDEDGAGFEAVITEDGESVIYRADEFKNMMRFSSLKKKSLVGNSETLIEACARNIMPAKTLTNGKVLVRKANSFRAEKVSKSLRKVAEGNDIVAFIENTKIALYVNGEKKVLAPLGEGNYIWPSVSPAKDKILFTKAGEGTFICDLEGNVISEIGEASAPSWSNDGKWVVYMKDYDDGHVITASDIFVKSVDGQKEYQLTSSAKEHEMYPVWSPVAQKVIYNTIDGSIYQIELDLE